MVWYEIQQVLREFGSTIFWWLIAFVVGVNFGPAGWVFIVFISIGLWGQAISDYYRYSQSPFGLFGKPPIEFQEWHAHLWKSNSPRWGGIIKELFIARGYRKVELIEEYVHGYSPDEKRRFLAGWRKWKDQPVTVTQIRKLISDL